MKRHKVNASAIDDLVKCGLSEDEAVAVLHVIKQGNKLTKPDYIITVEYGEKVHNSCCPTQ